MTLKPDGGTRKISIHEFYRLPGDTPQIETVLEHGELITHVELPPSPEGARQQYRKVRDRASYAFATVSVAAVLVRDGGRVTGGRVAFGGLAPRPWRVEAAEGEVGRGADAVADIALAGARPTEHNAYKLPLVRRTLAATFAEVTRS